ncbi:MAG: hypothetical protein E7188_03095 [Erysipelotrichaceae bacterium]|nr:hypothetical protein [Erysipelotrichaceae bacterium]
MTEVKNTKPGLAEYFDAVDRRIVKLAGAELYHDIKVCGQRLRVHYASAAEWERSRFSFTGMIDESEGMPDAHLNYWRDSLENYLPVYSDRSIYRVVDDTGELLIHPESRMKGVDHVNHRYYICRSNDRNTPLFGNSHDLLPLLDLWARENGMYIFHGAVVGTEGKGVIIAGKSHAGKSTLAIGCMMQGMDLVTDDQFMARKVDGVLYAMPVYRILGLNPDSYERLKPDLPVMDKLVPYEEKIFLDITGKKLPESLEVRAIVVPELAGAQYPDIRRCEKGTAIVRIVQSSVRKHRGNDTQETVAGMSRMLSTLPVYEISLSTDVNANADALHAFVRKELL